MAELNTALKDPSTGLSDNSDKTKQFKFLWEFALKHIANIFKEAGTVEGDSFEWKRIQELINRKYAEVKEISDVLYHFCTEKIKETGVLIRTVGYPYILEDISISITIPLDNLLCERIKLIDLKSYETGYPLLAQCKGKLPRLIFNKSDLERVLNEMIKSDAAASKLQEWARNNFYTAPPISKKQENEDTTDFAQRLK
ncbi:hypothetical protein [Snodgrassella alvi]|uniref:hypothetical protein n=1 Tax=Snodgrassella alvi TaxID=1196083 RepID=UPI000996D258|nr:hypothetical protein [Snodgrassella alvi]OOX79335.1 hypothetical protein BGH94_04645 [Snodgrassella alvi]ORF01869.1 hypothetical protein BGH95_06275 [Snodgrassella alvi]